MRIENTKTGVNYYTRTTKQHNGFVSSVVRQETKEGLPVRESLSAREIYPTRSKAYASAVKVCKTLARNHAWLN
jgi:hypothetical protein